MNASDVRKALNEALREADKRQEDHPWQAHPEWCCDCAAHNEGLSCCLDPAHGSYNGLLDYLAERIASKLMFRGGAVTNVVATVGEEIRPDHRVGGAVQTILDALREKVPYTGDGLSKYEEALKHWPANNLEIRIELSTNAHKVWVIDSHPKSREELHEKLKSIHGLRGGTEYVLVFYDVTANNAIRAVGSVVMQSTL